MKKSIFVFVMAVILMSCGNDRQQQPVAVDDGLIEQYSIFSEDSTDKKDTVESSNNKPSAANSSSKTTIRHDNKASDNMRGFDPASEDDMDDNGMSRYFENNDDEGWD